MRASLPLLLLVTALSADETADREKVLSRVAGRSAAVKDLRADYEQSSLREGLKKPVVSRGTLLFRADPEEGAVVLLKVSEPETAFIRVTRSKMETYLPEDKQVEVIDLKENEAGAQAVDATVLLYGKPREFWETHYEVSLVEKKVAGDPDELVLVPKDPELKKTLLEVRMWVSPEEALPVRVRYRYARGEEVTMTFGRVKPNTGLAARDLALTWPKDTEVLKP